MADSSLKPVTLRIEIPKSLKENIKALQRIAKITDNIFQIQREKRYSKFGENDSRHSRAENVMTVGEDEPKEVSYHEYFENELGEIASLLESTKIQKFKRIADALKDKEDIDFLKIKTIVSEDSGQIHITFGPFEQYSDPRHIRTDFQSDVLIKSDRYKNVAKFFENEDYNKWVPEAFRTPRQLEPKFFIGDMFIAGGFHEDILPMAQVLPNEPSLRREYGTMINIAANIIEAKTENNIVPIGEASLNSKIDIEKAKKIEVLMTLAHEIMHTVGRKREDYTSMREHVTFEEGKAISGSLMSAWNIIKENPELANTLRTAIEIDLTNYIRYLLRGIDNFAYGSYSSYAMSRLERNGAIKINKDSIAINSEDKYIHTIRIMQTEMLEVVANQNKEVYDSVLKEIKDFWNSKKIEGILNKVRSMKIFRDIKPTFELVYV